VEQIDPGVSYRRVIEVDRETSMKWQEQGLYRTICRVAIAGLVLLPLSLAGCAETVGAGAGAYAGNQFGKGSGKTAATAAGAVGGAIVGHEIAH
jgi:uncharacterized protein YcfJ